MQEFLDSTAEMLKSNPLIALVGWVMGIVGFYLRIQTSIKSTRHKKIPSYKIRSQSVITEKVLIDGLSVRFKDEPINTLTVSKIAIWNSGKVPIDSTDVPPLDPIRILSTKGIIYHIEIIKIVELSNVITIVPLVENKEYVISFEYLDFKQGALFNVIHSGKTSEDIEVNGIIKGFGRIVNKGSYVFEGLSTNLLRGNNSTVRSKSKILLMYFVMFSLSLGIPLLFRFKSSFANLCGGLMAIFMAIHFLIIVFYNPIPDGFELLEDEGLESKKFKN